MDPSTSSKPDEPKEEPVKEEDIKEMPPMKKKRKKSRKIQRAKGYPKFPKNGYVIYCDEVRPIVCGENPNLDPVEVTKLVAQKWYGLSAEEKQPYLEQAKLDKERFKMDLKEFNKNHPEDVPHSPSKKKSKVGVKVKSEQPKVQPSLPAPVVNDQVVVTKEIETPRPSFIGTNCELPIFTESFLEHNKVIEAELKMLRKNNIEIEQQNSVLMKHIENMVNGVTKVESEVQANKQRNQQLEIYLTRLRCILASGFNSLTLPAMKSAASVENIDKYVGELSSEATAANFPAIVTRASEILRKMDLKIPI